METILARALGQDVSKLAAEEKRQLLGRLLGRLAHEIRNPLSSLDIHVQLLEEDLAAIPAETRDKIVPRLEIIHGELHRLENIVKHFLRLSGPSELNLESVDVGHMVRHVCKLLEPEAQARGITLSADLPAEPVFLLADSAQLTQALLNLLINAIQAVERDGTIALRARAVEGFMHLEMRDTGPGIAPGELSTIFEPYFTTKQEGTGLGLWIAQQIASAHGGNLQAGNAPGGGALFTMRLPLAGKENPVG